MTTRRPRPAARGTVSAVLLVAALLGLASAGCGGGDAAKGLARDVRTARDSQAFTSLSQALVAAGLVRAESGGAYGSRPEDLAQKLQQRNPSLQFTTAPSTGPEQIQVLAAGSAVELVTRSQSNSYLGVWQSGGTTVYYKGDQPPAFSAQQPNGRGWGAAPPA